MPQSDTCSGQDIETGTLHQTRAASASAGAVFTKSVTLSVSDTNATAATTICNTLASSTSADAIQIKSNASGLWWTMPDCFYNALPLTIAVETMVLVGNTTYPDPLQRIGKSLPALTYFSLDRCYLRTTTAPLTTFDWTVIFDAFSACKEIHLTSLGLFGTLPATFPSALRVFDVAFNKIYSTIPATLFSSISPSATSFSFTTYRNDLYGPLPNPFFGTTSFPSMTVFSADFRSSGLTGDMPSALLPSSAPALTSFTVYTSLTQMNGSIPNALFTDILSKTFTNPRPTISIQASSTRLTGPLNLPAATKSSVANSPKLLLDFSFGNVTSITFGTNAAYYLGSLTANNNPYMTGTLDTLFASAASGMTTLQLSNSAISGTMPPLTSSAVAASLTNIYLTTTSIDFCSPSSRDPWTSSIACDLSYTDAASCTALYPNCVAVPSPVVPVPITPPVEAPTPISVPETVVEPVSTPFAAPIEVPVAATLPPTVPCLAMTKPTPGDSFNCVNGAWTSSDSIDVPTLEIPSGFGGNTLTVILGNLSSSQILFGGLGNTLEVHGCVTNLSSVNVNLKSEDLDQFENSKGRQVLVSLTGSGTGCSDLSAVTVKSDVTGSTCKKVTTEKEPQSTQLVALFSVSDAGCKGKSNTWWIIVVSVVCGVVVIGVVVLILVFTFNKKARLCCRPYEDSNGTLLKSRATSTL